MPHEHNLFLVAKKGGGGYTVHCKCGAYMAKGGLVMPMQKKDLAPKLTPPGPPVGNATIGDAIDYAKSDPGGFVAAVRWFVGFFVALFKK